MNALGVGCVYGGCYFRLCYIYLGVWGGGVGGVTCGLQIFWGDSVYSCLYLVLTRVGLL